MGYSQKWFDLIHSQAHTYWSRWSDDQLVSWFCRDVWLSQIGTVLAILTSQVVDDASSNRNIAMGSVIAQQPIRMGFTLKQLTTSVTVTMVATSLAAMICSPHRYVSIEEASVELTLRGRLPTPFRFGITIHLYRTMILVDRSIIWT